MNTRITPELMKAFADIHKDKLETNSIVKEHCNRNLFRQKRLFSFLKNEISKYSSLGFEIIFEEPADCNCTTNQGYEIKVKLVPFSILLKNKGIKYVFKPELNINGNIRYNFSLYENDNAKFTTGSLIWILDDEVKGSHWYFQVDHNSYLLKDGPFDVKGLKMLFTSMYCIGV